MKMKNINFSRWFAKSICSAVFLMGVVVQLPVVFAFSPHKYDAPPCYDVTGVSTIVNIGGVPNSGVMDFDDVGVLAVDQVCLRMNSTNYNKPDHLEGWAWNDNLGWVSFYCQGGFNLGRACGAQNYAVNLVTPGGEAGPNFSSVGMNGYAWGDNIGYISFIDNLTAKYHVSPQPSGVNRGLISSVSSLLDSNAWADAVGWLDFNNVQLNWEDIDPPLPIIPPPVLETCVGGGTCKPMIDGAIAADPADIPDADGVTKYTIEIPFVDGGNIQNTNTKDCPAKTVDMNDQKAGWDYCAKIELVWDDTVDYDQTTSSSQNALSNPYGINNSGAVRKPINYDLGTGDFVFVAPPKTLWAADVTSFAPTSEMNVNDLGGQNEKFYYPAIIPDGYDGTKTDQNKLVLKKLNLLFFKYGTGGLPGTCIYGDVVASAPWVPGNCKMRTYVSDETFSFKPLVDVKELYYVLGSEHLPFININTPDDKIGFGSNINISSNAPNANTNLKIGLNDDNYRMKFVPTVASNEGDATVESEINTLVGPLLIKSKWLAKIFYDPLTSPSFSSTANPYLYSLVKYTLSTVPEIKYFSNKLPRIKAGLLKNPVAKVEGNVYLTDFAAKTSDVTVRSLGNISSNLKREQILRNVSNYMNGFNGAVVTGNKKITDLDNPPVGLLTELVKDKVYYLEDGDLTIKCKDNECKYSGYKTFIVKNGNIYVNSDIKLQPGATGQIGLIALKDLSAPKAESGSMLVEAKVGWMQNVNVYLDRLMMSYQELYIGPVGEVVINCPSFSPEGILDCKGDDAARETRFINQLVFEGTISSQNGVGNASRSPAVDELGRELSGDTFCANYNGVGAELIGICRARVTDLNYLRYYGPGLQICTGTEGDPGSGAVKNVPKRQSLSLDMANGAGCNPSAPGYDGLNATCLYDETKSPNCDLIAGGSSGGKPSPYFLGKDPASLDNQFPVNFFYVPIDKELAGFEAQSNFNPLIQN